MIMRMSSNHPIEQAKRTRCPHWSTSCRTVGLLAGILLISGVHGMTQSVPQASQPTPSDKDVRSSYVLGPEDQIVVHALDVPDISDKPLRLDLNGDLKIPMIGRIHAGGLTSEQLEAEMTKRLSLYLEKPDVAVTIAEFHSQPVSVIGAVN